MRQFLVIVFLLTTLTFGQYWQKVGTVTGIYTLTMDNSNIYACMPAGGLLRSTDNGTAWNQIGSVFGTGSSVGTANGNTILVALDNGKVASTTNGGNTWVVGQSLIFIDWLSSANSNIYGVSFDKILKTTNNGTNWSTAYTFSSSGGGNPVISSSGSNVYALRYDSYLYRSTNNGTSWQVINTGLTNMWKVYPTSKGLFLVCGVAASEGVYKSTDNGSTWVKNTNGLNVASIVSILESKNGYLLAVSTFGEVYKSMDEGKNWKKIADGMYQFGANIGNVVLLSDNNILVGTINGVYKSSYPTDVKTEEVLARGYILSSYPNPFNPNTNIKYNNISGGYVSISIHDILGRTISTLVNEYKPAGEYVVSFSGKDLPSGIYIVRYGNIFKKIVLMK